MARRSKASLAALKGWETRRKAARARSRAAKRGAKTRAANLARALAARGQIAGTALGKHAKRKKKAREKERRKRRRRAEERAKFRPPPKKKRSERARQRALDQAERFARRAVEKLARILDWPGEIRTKRWTSQRAIATAVIDDQDARDVERVARALGKIGSMGARKDWMGVWRLNVIADGDPVGWITPAAGLGELSFAHSAAAFDLERTIGDYLGKTGTVVVIGADLMVAEPK